jgi:hypothetical protein
LSARITPICVNIVGPSRSVTNSSASLSACHSAVKENDIEIGEGERILPVAAGDELDAAGQRYWIIKWPYRAAIGRHAAA